MNPLSPVVTLQDVFVRVGLALLVGAVLGINRELRGKPAGVKTHALVTLGASVLTVASISFATMAGELDGTVISRVAQGIITGIGFLGAGVILRQSDMTIHGLTTAATIWLAACLGIVCGAGLTVVALTALGAALVVLLVGDPLERLVNRIGGGKQNQQE
jgi:putative Mg2+ transporter-C (MgtC) family protein